MRTCASAALQPLCLGAAVSCRCVCKCVPVCTHCVQHEWEHVSAESTRSSPPRVFCWEDGDSGLPERQTAPSRSNVWSDDVDTFTLTITALSGMTKCNTGSPHHEAFGSADIWVITWPFFISPILKLYSFTFFFNANPAFICTREAIISCCYA